MDNLASIKDEKQIANYKTVYKENLLSKPQEINITVTEEHIYGSAFISDQIGTREEEPLYSKFSFTLAEITKAYVNNNNKFTPLYIQCEDHSTGTMNRHRIILPGFNNNDEIIRTITNAKEALEKTLDAPEGQQDNQASVYSEKRLAFFEQVYRENVMSKPQEVNLTVTPQHIYGAAYICERIGANEGDLVYSRFVYPLDRIAKIYVNNNNKNAPIYIQCEEENEGTVVRRKIVFPKFPNNDAVIDAVNSAKEAYCERLEKEREKEKLKETERLRKAQDDEFMRITGGYKEMLKDTPEPAPASKPAPEPAPAPAPAPKPAPAPAPAPKPTPAPAPAPKPAPAPAPAPKPAPAPAPAPKPAPAPAPVHSGSVTIEDMLGLDDILGIKADEIPVSESYMDEISEEPDEELINSMPTETIQKNPDKIEELTVPGEMHKLEEVHAVKKPAEVMGIETLDTEREIAKKLSPKPAPAPAPTPASAPAPVKTETVIEEASDEPQIKGSDVSLEDFETAVKKLKTMLDNGVISESEFAVEKKKLFKLLY